MFGLWKEWRENIAMAVWYCLIVFPIIAGNAMPFYYLPVMPPFAFFSALALLKNERKEVVVDWFFLFMLVLVILVGAGLGSLLYQEIQKSYYPQKEAGELVAFRENVLVVMRHYYAPGIISYKALEEKRLYGRWLDFGWVLYDSEYENITAFLDNYHAVGNDVINGSFAKMFFEHHTYRKDTNITKFEYVAMTGTGNETLSGTLLYDKSDVIMIYQK